MWEGGIFEQGLGMAPLLLTIPPGVSGQALPSQGCVRREVLVTRMAALPRGWAPENLSPKQHRCWKCQGCVFITPAAFRVGVAFAGDPQGAEPWVTSREGHSSSMKSGLEAPPEEEP